MHRTALAILAGMALAGCAGNELTPQQIADQQLVYEARHDSCVKMVEKWNLTLKYAKVDDPDQFCIETYQDGGSSYDGTSADTSSGFRQPTCTGLCSIQRSNAARALDRKFNVNAGVNGWFGPSAGTSCTGLCGLQRYNAARALDRAFDTDAGVNGWFGPD